MSWARYYRTDRADVRAARALDMSGNAYVEGRGQAFADKHGATAMFTRGFAPHFAGITFHGEQKPKDPELWTKRTADAVLCRPRDKAVDKRHQQRSWELRRDWNVDMQQLEDIMKPRESAVLTLLGVTPDQIVGDHSLTYFDRGTFAYIASTLPIEGVEEIVASVFIAAAAVPAIKEPANG